MIRSTHQRGTSPVHIVASVSLTPAAACFSRGQRLPFTLGCCPWTEANGSSKTRLVRRGMMACRKK